MRALAASQRQVMAANRFGIPAMAHEECLTGLAAWQATVYPSPLCWGASFDPDLVEAMAARIGSLMARIGVHQGLAPVLDVNRDPRWGRTEETIAEDPYLVGTIGSAYVRGLQSAGIVATLKHFVGYSSSRAGRNLAPVSIGPRELADVLLPPFEMALRAGARSVMNSYTDNDGMPVGADATVLTDLLRDRYGFDGTVVSDYFAVCFLEILHHVASSRADAAGQALAAGIDVELPMVQAYGEPLLRAVRAGDVDEALVDRAVERVLTQKCELGLLDEDWEPTRSGAVDTDPVDMDSVDMDDAQSRALALELARRSIVLLRNDGTLPLPRGGRVAVVGPRADETSAMLGCYSFPMHVGVHHPDVPDGVHIPTVLRALRDDFDVTYAQGCPVEGGDDAGIAEAARVAADADTCVLVLGDKAGLFGGGTSGEGDDAARPATARQAAGTAGRGRGDRHTRGAGAAGRQAVRTALVDQLAAIVCGFFLGEEGGTALTDVLSGRVNPSGRLPVGFPAAGSSQPSTYLAAELAQKTSVTVIDPTPVFPFGHGLSYAPATWVGVRRRSAAEWADRRRMPDRRDTAQRRGGRHDRGGAGVPARSGGGGGQAGAAVDRGRAGRRGPRAGADRRVRPARRSHVVHRAGRTAYRRHR